MNPNIINQPGFDLKWITPEMHFILGALNGLAADSDRLAMIDVRVVNMDPFFFATSEKLPSGTIIGRVGSVWIQTPGISRQLRRQDAKRLALEFNLLVVMDAELAVALSAFVPSVNPENGAGYRHHNMTLQTHSVSETLAVVERLGFNEAFLACAALDPCLDKLHFAKARFCMAHDDEADSSPVFSNQFGYNMAFVDLVNQSEMCPFTEFLDTVVKTTTVPGPSGKPEQLRLTIWNQDLNRVEEIQALFSVILSKQVV